MLQAISPPMTRTVLRSANFVAWNGLDKLHLAELKLLAQRNGPFVRMTGMQWRSQEAMGSVEVAPTPLHGIWARLTEQL